jgi:hypothetical protein
MAPAAVIDLNGVLIISARAYPNSRGYPNVFPTVSMGPGETTVDSMRIVELALPASGPKLTANFPPKSPPPASPEVHHGRGGYREVIAVGKRWFLWLAQVFDGGGCRVVESGEPGDVLREQVDCAAA